MTPASTDSNPQRKISVYLLAAPEDREVCEAIAKHLKPIARDFPTRLEVDSDFIIPGGADTNVYKQRLFAADIVLVLISADFISNDDVYSRVQKVTERHNMGQTVMVPLLVRNCMWKATPFARLDVLPKNFQPLNNRQFWNSPDDALTAVVSEIYNSLNELARKGDVQLSVPPPTREAPSPAVAAGTAQHPAAALLGDAPALHFSGAAAARRGAAEELKPTPSTFAPSGATIDVDWRKKHYRNVVWKRCAALVLDYVIMFTVGFVIAMVFTAITGSEQAEDEVVLAMLITFYILCPLMESSSWQATIGKKIMKLQITGADGGRITFWRAFFRTVLRSMVFYLYFISIGVALIAQYFRFQKTKKLFHDEISSTVIGERLLHGSPAGHTVATA